MGRKQGAPWRAGKEQPPPGTHQLRTAVISLSGAISIRHECARSVTDASLLRLGVTRSDSVRRSVWYAVAQGELNGTAEASATLDVAVKSCLCVCGRVSCSDTLCHRLVG